MFCRKCGAKIPDESAFCLACGTKVNDSQQSKRDSEEQQPFRSAVIETKSSLKSCSQCDSIISVTALTCPICWKPQFTDSRKQALQVSLGTNAIYMPGTGLLGMLIINVLGKRKVKKIAKEVGAIDWFQVQRDQILILVTRDSFVFVVLSYAIMDQTTIPRNCIKEVRLDESKSRPGGFLRSKKESLAIEYFNPSAGKSLSEYWVFVGKNAREFAEFALAKFQEYRE